MKTCRRNWLLQFPKDLLDIIVKCQDTTAFLLHLQPLHSTATPWGWNVELDHVKVNGRGCWKWILGKTLGCFLYQLPTSIVGWANLDFSLYCYSSCNLLVYIIWAILCNKSWNENNTNQNERNVLDIYISLQVVYMSPVYLWSQVLLQFLLV